MRPEIRVGCVLILFAVFACSKPAAFPADKAKTAAAETPPYEAGGMWMPRQLEAKGKELESLGLKIAPSDLADPKKAPLAAAVSLGGCSASFVSPEGLVATNHHCITGILQYNATPEKNLVKDGYAAAAQKDELWAGPTQKMYVARRIEDVTNQMMVGLTDIADPRARYLESEKREKKLIADCERDRPEVRCRVARFFGGDEVQLVEQLEIRDVRLVYAPPEGVGNYGGEIDNWMWPRHAGDFAFLRAYVAPDGKPREFREDNVPFKPAHYLPVAKQGPSEKDLVMVMGYPGVTSRLATAHTAQSAVEWSYPRSIEASKEYIALIEKLAAGDADRKIKAAPILRGLWNYKKKYEGLLEGLTRARLVEERVATEARLALWIAEEPARTQQYGDVLPALKEIQNEQDAVRETDAAEAEFYRCRMLAVADTIAHMAQERAKPDAERDPEFQERNWRRTEESFQALDKRYDRVLDKGMLSLALERALRLPPEKRPPIVKEILGKNQTVEAIAPAVDALYKKTDLESVDTRVGLYKKASFKQLQRSSDSFIKLAVKLRPHFEEVQARDEAFTGRYLLLTPRYVRALRDMRGGEIAPDANGTLRVTYGTVKGYAPDAGAPVYHPFTYAPEMAKKDKGEFPFEAPKPLTEAVKANKYGPYAVVGKLPVDFLSDADITNGNSGSPTINNKGEWIGLAFDGNYEAMASDWVFMPKISRTIHTDIRYVLWVLDILGGDRVLVELGLKPAI
jgi:hypothetical protein